VSLRGHANALRCIPKGCLVVAANAGNHDPVRVLQLCSLEFGFWQNSKVTSCTLINKPFNQGLIIVIKAQGWERSRVNSLGQD